jgi:AcrR family transcriptional regulator
MIVAMPSCPTGALGLRERKKRARHDAIVDAAQVLVLERGLDAVTVEEIAEAAGISPRTFFNYFDSKDDAVLGLEPLELDPDVEAAFVAGGPTGRLLADVEVLIESLARRLGSDPARVARAMELTQAEPRLLMRHVAWMEAHRAALVEVFGRRRSESAFAMDPEVLAMLTFWLVRSASLAWERSGHAGDVADHVPSAVEQLAQLARS